MDHPAAKAERADPERVGVLAHQIGQPPGQRVMKSPRPRLRFRLPLQ